MDFGRLSCGLRGRELVLCSTLLSLGHGARNVRVLALAILRTFGAARFIADGGRIGVSLRVIFASTGAVAALARRVFLAIRLLSVRVVRPRSP